MAKTNGTPRSLSAKAKALLDARAAAGALYAKADELLEQILEKTEVGQEIKLPGKNPGYVVVVDNFADKEGNPKNKAWKPAGITRFDVQAPKRR